MQDVFIIGSKGIPANYGGYETFVEKITEYQTNFEIQYHVACAVDSLTDKDREFYHNGAHCFNIRWRNIGSAKAIFYDLEALEWAIKYVEENGIKNPIFYVLACRIGPFIGLVKKKIKKFGGTLLVNPDGHEWMRKKWSKPVRRYWKLSEKLMVKNADMIVCDSTNIEKYIRREYEQYSPCTKYISYGAETKKTKLEDDDEIWMDWLKKNNILSNEYYLVVGRFVPENNYEIMIKEFIKSNTKKAFVLVTQVTPKFLETLKKRTSFDLDSRIKFVGAIYNQDLLKKIRENAYGYFHGHEVGGTNPSLLEAMVFTNLNLLVDVGFNREVGQDGVLYWKKEENCLAELINYVDGLNDSQIKNFGDKAKGIISERYTWPIIVREYENEFLRRKNDE